MKIKCYKCNTKFEVDSGAESVSCQYCMMEKIKLVLDDILEELKLINEDKHLEKYKKEFIERFRNKSNKS
jgi:hypothetical protein